VQHVVRPGLKAYHPVLVTLRMDAAVGNIRAPKSFAVVKNVLRAKIREGFRCVHYSVMSNHVHMIVETEDKELLANAVRALQIKIAHRLNRLLGRKGRAFSDRYHARALTNRRQTRNAIAYTLLNRRKHGDRTKGIDPCSSGLSFDGFKNQTPREAPPFKPETWLLKIGWKIHGLIDLSEVPGQRGRAGRGQSSPHIEVPRRHPMPKRANASLD